MFSFRSQRAPRSLPLGDARSSGSRAATWVVPRAVAHSLKSPELGQWGSGLSRIPGGGGALLDRALGTTPGVTRVSAGAGASGVGPSAFPRVSCGRDPLARL